MMRVKPFLKLKIVPGKGPARLIEVRPVLMLPLRARVCFGVAHCLRRAASWMR